MPESLTKSSPGQLVADALSGSWRESDAPPRISSAELAAITQLLIQSGAGALVWWRIRNSALATSAAAARLREFYRLHRLEAVLHLQKIKRILARLRAAGIEPVLVKGWSVARLYPEPGLRHYFDADLCVARSDYPKAQQLLAALGEDGWYVDLHRELDHLDVIGWEDFFAHSQLLKVDDLGADDLDAEATEIRVPCAEDHLRIVCIHWLRHGAWKPAGLCDVAAMLESLPANFDWQRCLGPDRVRAGWVACTIGLARQLLGAGSEPPGAQTSCLHPLAASALPRWLVPAVLRQWSNSFSPNHREQALPALLGNVTKWQELVRQVRARLDQPVRATVALHGRFNNWPRWPYQLGELLLHTSEVPKQLAMMIVSAADKLNSRGSSPTVREGVRLFAAERR